MITCLLCPSNTAHYTLVVVFQGLSSQFGRKTTTKVYIGPGLKDSKRIIFVIRQKLSVFSPNHNVLKAYIKLIGIVCVSCI